MYASNDAIKSMVELCGTTEDVARSYIEVSSESCQINIDPVIITDRFSRGTTTWMPP